MIKKRKLLIRLATLAIAVLFISLTILPSFAVEKDPTRRPPNPIEIETSITVSRGEAHLLQPGYVLDTGETYTWTSSDTSVATVTSYGLVNGVSSGTATVTVVLHTNDWGNYSKKCSVTVGSSGIISNGTYFIHNVNADKYIDIEGPSTSNDAYLQLWQMTAATQRRWNFTLGTDGYYRIQSVYSSKYMRVTGSSATAGATITQNSSIVSGSKWALMRTAAGNYVFVPASSTSSLVVLNAPGTTNGYNLNTATYTQNTDYKDEWKVFLISKSISGVPISLRSNEAHTCIPCAIVNVAGYWSTHGYSMFNCSTSAQQETAAVCVQNAMNWGGGYGATANIQNGFNILNTVHNGKTYSFNCENIGINEAGFSIADIMDEINNGRPIMLGFGGSPASTGNPYNGGHMTVCYGYYLSSDGVHVLVSNALSYNAGIDDHIFNTSYNYFICKVKVMVSQ
ncbi:MAG: RICIN domain-containing protein [Clostridia bacterium]|nr:RICIN domain-containing protein [Clostridia bacterium]